LSKKKKWQFHTFLEQSLEFSFNHYKLTGVLEHTLMLVDMIDLEEGINYKILVFHRTK
jgi:hypothetical protein